MDLKERMNFPGNLLFTVLCLGMPLLCSAGKASISFEDAKEHIVVRKIGHDLLRYLGDTSSQLPPVKVLNANEYQLQFRQPFTFRPDSLVAIIHRIILENGFADDYIVNVMDCFTEEVVFGYAILDSEQNDIVPCLNRYQPENCYLIKLKLAPEKRAIVPLFVFIALVFVLLIGLGTYYWRRRSKLLGSPQTENLAPVPLGQSLFYLEEQYFVCQNQRIPLTKKETQLLKVLMSKENQLFSRDYLEEEIWGKEGTIVGRSLDVFISRLRKKLACDTSLEVVNSRGRGYSLRVR